MTLTQLLKKLFHNYICSYFTGTQQADLKNNTRFTIRVDKNKSVIYNSNGAIQKDFVITVKSGFFDKLVSFFKNLFGGMSTVIVKL